MPHEIYFLSSFFVTDPLKIIRMIDNYLVLVRFFHSLVATLMAETLNIEMPASFEPSIQTVDWPHQHL